MYRPKLLAVFVLLSLALSFLFVHFLYPYAHLRTFRSSNTMQVDTVSQDTLVGNIMNGEEVIKDFFNAYCDNFNDNDSRNEQLCYDFMTRDYATKFVKNAPICGPGGVAYYCDRCEEYEGSDFLHFIFRHSIPGGPEKIWLKSITEDSAGRYIVIVNAEWMMAGPEISERRFRVSVRSEDGENKICRIEDFDNNPTYDFAVIRAYRNENIESADTIY